MTKDGVGWAGQEVRLVWRGIDGKYYYIVMDDIGGGYYKSTITAGYDMACHTISYWAIWSSDTVEIGSNRVDVTYLYPTRLSISAPGTVAPGQRFTISGKLEYEESRGVWKGLASKTVELYIDAEKLADVTTNSDGSYSYSHMIVTPKTYTLKAVFRGNQNHYAPSEAELTITAEEVPGEWWPIALAIGAAGAACVGGVIAYNEYRKRELEKLLVR